jgi:hypothetical protein
MSAMDALKGFFMAAVIASTAILASVLAPTVAVLMIALVSLKGTQPADRPAILRALAALPHRRDQRAPQPVGAENFILVTRPGDLVDQTTGASLHADVVVLKIDRSG